METTKLSTKGQIILPKSIRTTHNWGPGTEFTVEDTSDGVLLKPVKKLKRTRLKDIIGCTGYKGPTRTIEEMDAGIDAMFRKAWRDRR